MRLTTIILVTALCISVVSSNPLPGGEGLQSQVRMCYCKKNNKYLFIAKLCIFVTHINGKGLEVV